MAGGPMKRKLQAYLDAVRGKKRRLDEQHSCCTSTDASVAHWQALASAGILRDGLLPCLGHLDLLQLEAAHQLFRGEILDSGAWETVARRELSPTLVDHFLRVKGIRHVKALLAAKQRGVLNPSMEDRGLATYFATFSDTVGRAWPFSCSRRSGSSSSSSRCPKASLKEGLGFEINTASPVTCMCFGQEHARRSYILLALAFEDGQAVVLRCHRTPLERAMLAEHDVANNKSSGFRALLGAFASLTYHSIVKGHKKAVTAVFFKKREDQLVTASLDKKICVWDISTGGLYSNPVTVFADSAPLLAVVPMTLVSDEAFVASNGNGTLRAVNLMGGAQMQRFKLNVPTDSLRFDDAGRNLLAASKRNGKLLAFTLSTEGWLSHRFTHQTGVPGITCLEFAPAAEPGRPDHFLVGGVEASVVVAECVYGKGRVLLGLQNRRKVVASPPHALRTICFSQMAGGTVVCGSADGSIHRVPLAGGVAESLREHPAPVTCLAINAQDTILASADTKGSTVLCRQTVHFPC